MERAICMLSVIMAVWLACPQASAGADADPGAVCTRHEDHMGTYVSITVAAPESPRVLAAIRAGFKEVVRLEKLLSEWRSDSEIAEVNRQAGLSAVVVGQELFSVARMAHDVSVKSQGAFDVTFAALAGLWNYKAPQPRIPDEADIRARVRLVDFRQVVLDEVVHSVKLAGKGMRMGLGGIAKGYVVDRVSAVLKGQGFRHHLVVAGGDLFASGTRGGRKWRIGIRNPDDRGVFAKMEVEDEGVATSGNYEKFFILEGVRYHHILDPRTGWPARGISSLTVVAKSAAQADAWATALFVAGKARALALAEKEGLDVFLFDEHQHTASTPGMPGRLLNRVEKSPSR